MKTARIRGLLLAALAALALTATRATASLVTSFSDIQYWVGTGSNQAALVIDWNDGTESDSFVWGFRWDGTATGEDMFLAIAGAIAEAASPDVPDSPVADGSGDPALSLYILSYSFGPSVDRITFTLDGVTHDQDSGGFSDGFWSYWTATGSDLPATWTDAQIGFADRTLENNSWDGWSFAADYNGVAPDEPLAAPVPEPATLVLFGAGALVLLLRRPRPRHA